MCRPAGYLISLVTAAQMLAAGAGCSKLTEIVVVVDTNLELDTIGFEAAYEGGGGDKPEPVAETSWSVNPAHPNVVSLPVSCGLLPGDDASRPLLVTINGVHRGKTVVKRQARLGFVEGRVLLLRLDLLHSCVGVDCGPAGSCGEQGCEPIDRDASRLPDYTPEAAARRVPDAGPPASDAAPDAADAGPSNDAPPPSSDASPSPDASLDAADAGPSNDASPPASDASPSPDASHDAADSGLVGG